MVRLNPVFLHRVLQLLLFSVFWEKFSGTLSYAGGIGILVIFGLIELLVQRLVGRKFPVLSNTSRSIAGLLLFSLFILFLYLTGGAAALTLSHFRELLFLSIYNYLLPVIPVILLFRILILISLRGRYANLGVLVVYTGFLTALMSRRDWMMTLPFESLILTYAFIYLFVLAGVFLVLSGGERGRTLSVVHLLVLALLPLVILVPLSRNYSSQSKKESGGLLESSLFRFDFSDYLSLESSISMKDDLVFMMKKEGPESDFMVRRFILPEYSVEKGFFRIPGQTLESPGIVLDESLLGETFHEWEIPSYPLTEPVPQEYYLVNFDSSAFLGMNSPASVTPYQSWDHSSFSRIFRVDSLVSSAWGWDLMGAAAPAVNDEASGKFMDYYTSYGGQEDLRTTAENIISGLDGYYDKVEAIETYLKDNYFYSLNPGTAEDGDQLRHFLYDSRKGYCSYFAFSMALLCRSAGIPARVALGFWVSGSSGVLNYYPVKANQAHAWVEVYFPDFGWMEFDPTSQTPAPGEEYLFSPLSAQEIEPYLREILENREFLKIAESGGDSEAENDAAGGWTLLSLSPASGIVVILIGFLLSFLLIRLIRIMFLLRRIPLSKRHCSWYFHFHFNLTEALNRHRRQGESFQEYSHEMAVSLPELSDFTALYERIRFGWSSLSDREVLFQAGRNLRRLLRKELSLSGRLKYAGFMLFRGWGR